MFKCATALRSLREPRNPGHSMGVPPRMMHAEKQQHKKNWQKGGNLCVEMSSFPVASYPDFLIERDMQVWLVILVECFRFQKDGDGELPWQFTTGSFTIFKGSEPQSLEFIRITVFFSELDAHREIHMHFKDFSVGKIFSLAKLFIYCRHKSCVQSFPAGCLPNMLYGSPSLIPTSLTYVQYDKNSSMVQMDESRS